MDPCWEGKPYLYKVYVRSGGLFDHSLHWKKERAFCQMPVKVTISTEVIAWRYEVLMNVMH